MKGHHFTVLIICGIFFFSCTQVPLETNTPNDSPPEETGETETGETEDTDEPITNPTISGSIHYITTESGELKCNSTTTFTGINNPELASDNHYVFEITSVITENEGNTYLCERSPNVTLDSEYFALFGVQLILIFSWDYYDTGPYLCAGEELEGGGSVCNPIANASDITIDGSTLSWEWETDWIQDYNVLDVNLFGVCTEGSLLEGSTCGVGTNCNALPELVAGVGQLGSITADNIESAFPDETTEFGNRDIWTFFANAGELIQVSVDTASSDTWDELSVILNAPDECTIALFQDPSITAPCSAGTIGLDCPSFEIEAPTTGTYSLSIHGHVDGEAREIDYSLITLVNFSDASMTLASDNAIYMVSDIPLTVQVEGTATVIE